MWSGGYRTAINLDDYDGPFTFLLTFQCLILLLIGARSPQLPLVARIGWNLGNCILWRLLIPPSDCEITFQLPLSAILVSAMLCCFLQMSVECVHPSKDVYTMYQRAGRQRGGTRGMCALSNRSQPSLGVDGGGGGGTPSQG